MLRFQLVRIATATLYDYALMMHQLFLRSFFQQNLVIAVKGVGVKFTTYLRKHAEYHEKTKRRQVKLYVSR